jgi:uncharacterized protein
MGCAEVRKHSGLRGGGQCKSGFAMKVQLESSRGLNVIRSYAPGQVTVNQEVYARSLVVTPDRVLADWPPLRFEDLVRAHFEMISELRPEVVLLGTGARLRFPEAAHTLVLVRAGIGLEVMDTAAACRTYNVLVADGRRVAAALLMIDPAQVESTE